MKNSLHIICTSVLLAACQNTDNGVRISTEKTTPTPQPVVVVAKARSEPIFYNGKTYRLNFAPAEKGVFDMAVGGMSAKQKADAVAVATSSLRYFACPEGKTGKLVNTPAYMSGSWKMRAQCG
jgi:hypothetical protein